MNEPETIANIKKNLEDKSTLDKLNESGKILNGDDLVNRNQSKMDKISIKYERKKRAENRGAYKRSKKKFRPSPLLCG